MYSSDVRHIAGRDNPVADILSRPEGVPLGANYTLSLEDDEFTAPADLDPLPEVAPIAEATEPTTPLVFNTVSHEALRDAQQSCPEVANHKKGNHPRTINMTFVETAPGVSLYCDISTKRPRPLLPVEHRRTIYNLYHMINHPGISETIRRVQGRYYWPSLRQDVAKWAKECEDCLVGKSRRTITPPVSHIPIMPTRFTQLQFDIVGPLVPSNGFRYLLTVTDRTSRWVEAYPMKDATSESCLTEFINNWVPRFGVPLSAVSDNGASFISGLWKGLHEELGTIVTYTPPYHAQSFGSLERQHKDIKLGFRTILNHMQDRYGSKWLKDHMRSFKGLESLV